jgi:peptidoglycan hydrolase CwlO-like protein
MNTSDTISQLPLDQESVRARLALHEKKLAALSSEQARLNKRLDELRAQRQTLEAVAKKVANRRSCLGQ